MHASCQPDAYSHCLMNNRRNRSWLLQCTCIDFLAALAKLHIHLFCTWDSICYCRMHSGPANTCHATIIASCTVYKRRQHSPR